MQEYKLGVMEGRFADLIWESAPISTAELVKLCQQEFDWKRTTAYTMLKRLCERELFANENGTVTVLTSKEEFEAAQGEQFIKETFGGSLPRFLTAFSRRNKLGEKEIEELKRMIEESE